MTTLRVIGHADAENVARIAGLWEEADRLDAKRLLIRAKYETKTQHLLTWQPLRYWAQVDLLAWNELSEEWKAVWLQIGPHMMTFAKEVWESWQKGEP